MADRRQCTIALTPSDCRANLRDFVAHDPRRPLPSPFGRALARRRAAASLRAASCSSPPRSRDHGDWATTVALTLRSVVGGNPLDIAERIEAALEAADVPHLARAEIAGPGLRQPLPRAHAGCTTCSATSSRRATATARSTALAGRRINLEFVSANPTGPLHAGGGRWVAVGDAIANLLAAQGADGAPRVLPQRHRQPARDLPRLAVRRAIAASEPPEDGYQGQYLVDLAAAAARRARRRRHAPTTRASGACRRIVEESAGRSRAHRRALRHVVLGAHAARARRGRRRARAARRRRASSTTATAPAGCAPPTSATQRDRVLVRADGSPRRISATTSRTTATSSAAAPTTSSTSGAPTTTAR